MGLPRWLGSLREYLARVLLDIDWTLAKVTRFDAARVGLFTLEAVQVLADAQWRSISKGNVRNGVH